MSFFPKEALNKNKLFRQAMEIIRRTKTQAKVIIKRFNYYPAEMGGECCGCYTTIIPNCLLFNCLKRTFTKVSSSLFLHATARYGKSWRAFCAAACASSPGGATRVSNLPTPSWRARRPSTGGSTPTYSAISSPAPSSGKSWYSSGRLVFQREYTPSGR